MFNYQTAIRILLRRPAALESWGARAAVLALAATGGGFLVWSAVIHLKLWAEGYKDISLVGPLFLVQAIVCIVVGVAVVVWRRPAMLVVGAGAGVVTAIGLLLSAYAGAFGFKESLNAPYATLSLAVEFTAAFVLLAGAVLLALAAPVKAGGEAARVQSRRNLVPFTLTQKSSRVGSRQK